MKKIILYISMIFISFGMHSQNMQIIEQMRISQGESIPEEANVWIGGIGGDYGTPELFSALTNLSASDFQSYTVDENNNVSFYIDGNYALDNNNQFYNDATITYYIDTGALNSMQLNNFRNCSSLEYFHAPSMDWTNAGGGRYFLLNANHKGKFEYLGTGSPGHALLQGNSSLDMVYFPNSPNAGSSQIRPTMASLSGLERLYIPSMSTIYHEAGGILNFDNIASNVTYYLNPALQTNGVSRGMILFNNNIAVGDTVTINGLVYTLVTSGATEGEWNYNSDARRSSSSLATQINSDTRIGTSGDVIAYSQINEYQLYFETDIIGASGDAITYSISNSPGGGMVADGPTFTGGGGEHPQVGYFRDDKSGTIVWVDDYTIPNPPTGLYYSSLDSDSVVLNFSPPPSVVNGIGGYEVYINDGVSPWQPYLRFTEISDTGEEIDLTGINIGGLKIKIRTFDGHYNLSAFTEEITLP
jgi:hypothetical protein